MRVAGHWVESRRYERSRLYVNVILETRPEAPMRGAFQRSRDTTLLPIHLHARCVEIGCGGLRCEAEQALPPGARVGVSIDLGSRAPFVAIGRVVWARITLRPVMLTTPRTSRQPFDDDATMGIAFEGLAPDAMLPIAALIESRRRAVLPVRRSRPPTSLR